MNLANFPTSKDIFIEIDGKRIAVVESYKTKSSRESRHVEAFGEDEPVGTIGGRTRHIIELSRVYITKSAMNDGISFHNLADFNIVIVKPDRRIIFSGCEWAQIAENASLNETVVEQMTVISSSRIEIFS